MARSSRAAAAFAVYLDLGPDRSLVALHRTLRADPAQHGFRRAPALRTIESWSARDGWGARIAAIERQAREEEERAHVERVQQYRARLRQEGVLLQQKGIGWLKDKEADEVRVQEAVRAIGEGFRLEALGLGEVTDRVAVREEYSDVFERLNDAELDRLVRILRAAPGPGADGALAPPSR